MQANNRPRAIWSVVKDSLNINDRTTGKGNKINLTYDGFNNFCIGNVDYCTEYT